MYQAPKQRDYEANTCAGCLEKQQIDRLIEENQRLKVALGRRERKLQHGFFGSSTPSSQMPVKENSSPDQQKARGGARPGHVGHGRRSVELEEASQLIEVRTATHCPDCGERLMPKGFRDRSVIEIEEIEPQKILYQLEKSYCPGCQKSLPARAPGVLPRSLLGNQLLTEVIEGHYLQGQPLSRVCERFDLQLGTVVDALHRVGRYFAPVLEYLKREYRESDVRHADETGWRTDGQNGDCWLFCTEKLSLYLYGRTRSSKVVKEVLGEQALAGTLVVDRYVGYNQAPCRLQYCFAHLLREVEDLQGEFARDQEVQVFTARLIPLLAEAMHLRGMEITDEQYYQRAEKIKQEMEAVAEEPARHLAVRKWQDFLVEQKPRLYWWVEDRRVPAENNRAERELRPTVIARKVSFGSQSEAGARTRAVLMSLMQTLRKRVEEPRRKLREVLDRIAEDQSSPVVKLLFGADTS